MLLDINKIRVNDRIRKDFGNIEELANDIKENGLINPPVVTPEYELIAGERRLRACKLLGMNAISVNVMTVRDYEHQLRLEISENENRKEFTFSERVEWAKRLEKVESMKAKERQELGVRPNSDEGGRTDDKVAKESGFGGRDTYRKAKFIAEHADEEAIARLDAGESSINREYEALKKKFLEAERKLKEEQEARELAEQQATHVINVNSQLRQENERLKREKNPEPKVIEVEKVIERVPDDVQKQIDWDKLVIANAKADIQKLRDELNTLKLQQTDDFDPEQAKIRKHKLQLEADISTLQLKIHADEFLAKTSRIAFMEGALAAAEPSVKRKLTDAITSIEKFLATVKQALNSKIIVEEAQYKEV